MDNNIQSPFFSIITPVYNCEKYLRECIESVIRQTYTSWELILVDDGSEDMSGEICDRYCNDPRIKVIHQNNMGALQSRLNGIAVATGKYELGLDADDYLDMNCLQIIKDAIDESECDLIFFGLRLIGNQEEDSKCSLKAGEKYSREEIVREVIAKTNHSLCNKAIKLEKVKQADFKGLDKKGRVLNDDYALIVPILCNIHTGYVLDSILYNYRIYEESSSNKMVTVEYIQDTSFVTEFVISKLKSSIQMNEDIYSAIYFAYINMILSRLITLFVAKAISDVECDSIRMNDVYKNAEKYERIQSVGWVNYLILKLFRYKQYGLIRIMATIMHRKMKQ